MSELEYTNSVQSKDFHIFQAPYDFISVQDTLDFFQYDALTKIIEKCKKRGITLSTEMEYANSIRPLLFDSFYDSQFLSDEYRANLTNIYESMKREINTVVYASPEKSFKVSPEEEYETIEAYEDLCASSPEKFMAIITGNLAIPKDRWNILVDWMVTRPQSFTKEQVALFWRKVFDEIESLMKSSNAKNFAINKDLIKSDFSYALHVYKFLHKNQLNNIEQERQKKAQEYSEKIKSSNGIVYLKGKFNYEKSLTEQTNNFTKDGYEFVNSLQAIEGSIGSIKEPGDGIFSNTLAEAFPDFKIDRDPFNYMRHMTKFFEFGNRNIAIISSPQVSGRSVTLPNKEVINYLDLNITGKMQLTFNQYLNERYDRASRPIMLDVVFLLDTELLDNLVLDIIADPLLLDAVFKASKPGQIGPNPGVNITRHPADELMMINDSNTNYPGLPVFQPNPDRYSEVEKLVEMNYRKQTGNFRSLSSDQWSEIYKEVGKQVIKKGKIIPPIFAYGKKLSY